MWKMCEGWGWGEVLLYILFRSDTKVENLKLFFFERGGAKIYLSRFIPLPLPPPPPGPAMGPPSRRIWPGLQAQQTPRLTQKKEYSLTNKTHVNIMHLCCCRTVVLLSKTKWCAARTTPPAGPRLCSSTRFNVPTQYLKKSLIWFIFIRLMRIN